MRRSERGAPRARLPRRPTAEAPQPPAPQPPAPQPPGPTPTPPARDRTAPRLALAGGTLKVTKGTVAVKIVCPKSETRCAGTVSLASATKLRIGKAKKAKVLALGSKAFRVAGGKTVTVVVKLSSAGRRLLAARKVRAVLRVAVADAAGNRATASRVLTVAKITAVSKKKPVARTRPAARR